MTQPWCPCKGRALTACPGEWEPGCELGNNPAYVRVFYNEAKEATMSYDQSEADLLSHNKRLHAEIDRLRADSELLAWVLTHPETSAEVLQDASWEGGTVRALLERRRDDLMPNL